MRSLLDSKSQWKVGDSVSGEYFFVSFSGKLNGSTRPTPDYRNVIFCIDLDQEITVFGLSRKRIEIWSNDEQNKIYKD